MIHLRAACLLTDIEGTTTDIAFVHRVLFPYALKHMAEFVVAHAEEPAVREQLDAVAELSGCNPLALEKLVDHLEGWIDEDRKLTPLKALQGMIWREGYASGAFTGHLYPDAHAGLQRWHEAGIALYVYSSGSIAAQQLLYGHSDFGDLRPWFSGYFDTTSGAKKDAASYARIAGSLPAGAAQTVFLSDVVEELDAAAEAGMQTVQLVRADGMVTGAHPVAHSFDDISLEAIA